MATQTETVPQGASTQTPHHDADHAAESTAMPCPDPSAHKTKDTSLQDHASAAALNPTSPSKASTRRVANPLGPDGRLSTASAATSLKHARAHDLPSFPVVGIDTHASANAAASLAQANIKSPELWKPEHSAAAGKAAFLAKDYKMQPLWQPEASAAGSKAAMLAHKGSISVERWTPESSARGFSAANLAVERQRPAPEVDYGYTEHGQRSSLVAATGAVSTSGRPRARSTPEAPALYPDAENAGRNALNAATVAHRPSRRAAPIPSDRFGSDAMEAARIQHARVSREMYTATPPVSLEVEEKRRQDALRASAVSMARKMYDPQHQQPGQPSDLKEQAMRYIGIQEAAQRLAAERLSRIGFDEEAAYRSYYGYEKPSRARLSLRLGRTRASTNPEPVDSDDEDELRSRRIRSQMTQFNKKLAEVDAKKREEDRKHLLAAAQRKVHAEMQSLDKRVFEETGYMSPSMMEEWDAKARAKAAADSEARMEHHGKVYLGHGKYMDQAEVDAIALAKIQPTLDEITEKTEKRRAEEEERRLDLEEKKREQRIEKERAAEIKAEEKRFKREEKKAAKERSAAEKAAAKESKTADRAKQAEEEPLATDEQRKEEHAEGEHAEEAHAEEAVVATPAAPIPTRTEEATTAEEAARESPHEGGTTGEQVAQPAAEEPAQVPAPTAPTEPSSPPSDSRGFKGFLNKFKRRSRQPAATTEPEKPGFIGGAALQQQSAQPTPAHEATPSSPPAAQQEHPDVSSLSSGPEEVEHGPEAEHGPSTHEPETVSPVSTGPSAEKEEARDGFDEELAPPPKFPSEETESGREGSPKRDSRFREVL